MKKTQSKVHNEETADHARLKQRTGEKPGVSIRHKTAFPKIILEKETKHRPKHKGLLCKRLTTSEGKGEAIVSHHQTELRVHPKGRKSRYRETIVI